MTLVTQAAHGAGTYRERNTIDAVALDQRLSPQVAEQLGRGGQLLIDGKFVPAASGKTFAVYNPATGTVISNVAEGDVEDVNRAVAAARRAFDDKEWSRTAPSVHGRLLWKLADLIEQHTEEFAQLESIDNGKPVAVARVADVPLAIDTFRYMAGWATKITGRTSDISMPGEWLTYSRKEPVGVVGQIIPWSFPLLMAAWKLAPALAAGAANAIFFNMGQCCVAGSRLLAHKKVYDQIVEGVAEIAGKLKVGEGMDPSTEIGPLVSEKQFKRVTGFLSSGRDEGARVVKGSDRVGNQGYFVAPRVLADTTDQMKVVREEISGPVVCAASFADDDLERITREANKTSYGLAASVWIRDHSLAHWVANRLRAGTVWINCHNVFDAAQPFGGCNSLAGP